MNYCNSLSVKMYVSCFPIEIYTVSTKLLVLHFVVFQLSLDVAEFLLHVIKELQGKPYLAVKPLKLLKVGVNMALVCPFMELQLSRFHAGYLLLILN